MLTDKQKSMIQFTPTFRICQLLPGGGKVSVVGQRGKGIIELALIDSMGFIDHNPPFEHDGYGIATFGRDEANRIATLMSHLYIEATNA